MFENIMTRHDATSATLEIIIMLAVMFFLGYIFGRLFGRKKRLKNASRYEQRMQELEGVHRE
jgi:flagellar biogenesis protein FliO